MKTVRAIRAALVVNVLALVELTRDGWAQAVPGGESASSTPPSGGAQAVVLVGSAILLLVILGVLVKMLDLKRRREGEAVIVQSQVSDAVLRDPALFSLPITPTARVPLWSGSPVIVEVAGCVPSDELREAALRLIQREASHLRNDVQIESRLDVVPTMMRRSA
ncbi:MAG: hypothetical protein DME04_08445 [Candidatus Rokuibacteriota bacterium]|nr:MAG: hypothetical protein DME04_08445 [Candidatus Rokubacteria bacterium]